MPKRKKEEGQGTETDLGTCPICLEVIAQRAAVHVSRCQPVPHITHERCWKRQPQRDRCCLCRQVEVDDLTFAAVAELCCVKPARAKVVDLTPCGISMIENLQRGVISRRELWSFLLWMRSDGDRPRYDVMRRLMFSPDTSREQEA